MPEFDSHGLRDGVWTGLLTADVAPARLALTRLGEVVAEARMTADGEGRWHVAADLPATLLSDGTHAILLIADDAEGLTPVQPGAARLDRLNITAGAALADDLEAEIQLLRAELELLKREFRRMGSGQ